MPHSRLDVWLLEHGLAESRARAAALAMAGLVTVNGRMVDKPGYPVRPDDRVELADRGDEYVSRGGVKLAGALDDFGIDVAGLTCLDAGASTGGFTDVLLRRGACRVYAVDVGHAQLHERLRADPRVVNIERTNLRHLEPDTIPEPVQFVTADLAFISLRLVVPALLERMPGSGRRLLLLVKPQFEAGPKHLRKGVVRDPEIQAAVVAGMAEFAAGLGLSVEGTRESRITGPKGNREFFLFCREPEPD